MEKLECKNCGEVVAREYCGACGQKYEERVTFKSLANEIYDGFFNFESPFLKSFVFLTINPGKVFRDYMEGAKKRYFSPVRYSFWTLAFVIAIAGFYDVTLIPDMGEDADKDLNSIMAFLNTMVIPMTFVSAFATACVTRLFFRKEKYTVLEWFSPVLLTYTHYALFSVPAIIMGIYSAPMFISVYVTIQSLYFAWAIGAIFKPYKVFNFIKGFITSVLGQLASMMFSSIVMVLVLVILKSGN